MLKEASCNRLVESWLAAIVVIVAAVAASGVNVAVSTTALLLALSVLPPPIILRVWQRNSEPTVAEILYSANTAKEGRS